MKLNSYFNKPVITKPQATVLQLGNEARETELENRIKYLEQELANRIDNIEKVESLETQLEIDKKLDSSLRKDFSNLTEKYEKNRLLVETLSSTKADLDTAKLEMQQLIATSEQQQNTIEAAQQNSSMLQKRYEELQQEFNTLASKYGSLENDHIRLKDIASEQDTSIQDLTFISKNLKDDNNNFLQEKEELTAGYSDALTQLYYWQDTANRLADELDANADKEQQLRQWIETLKQQTEQETAKSKGAKNRLKNTQRMISEMSGQLEQIEESYQNLQEVNVELQAEVMKPTYNSFGAVKRLEGFEMSPMGAAINRNKLYLGNAKPTLLKFEHKEEKKNDD